MSTLADKVSQRRTTAQRAENPQLHWEPQKRQESTSAFTYTNTSPESRRRGEMQRSSEKPIQQCEPLLLLFLLLLLPHSCWISLLTSPSAHRRSALVAAWIIGKGGERFGTRKIRRGTAHIRLAFSCGQKKEWSGPSPARFFTPYSGIKIELDFAILLFPLIFWSSI